MQIREKLWPIGHRRFEEMCVLASTGQLGGAQMCELDAHIASCKSCRELLESVAQVSVQVMPILADQRGLGVGVVPPEGMRERFLSRLASFERSGEADTAACEYPSPVGKGGSVPPLERQARYKPLLVERAQPTSMLNVSSRLWRAAVVVAASVFIGFLGYYLGELKTSEAPQQLVQNQSPVAPTSRQQPLATDSDRVNKLEQQQTELEGQLVKLKRELSSARAQKQSLSTELAAAKSELAALTAQAESAAQRSSGEIEQANNQVSSLEGQVDRLNRRLGEAELMFQMQKQTANELAAKLDSTRADLELERQLKSAKLQLGDLAAARNLHIVDVYDSDSDGHRARSFGRVFYIEGKSLVFYAYDLDVPGRFKANVVFRVWGGKAGVKEVTHNLGILHKDDQGQARWALTFDDPTVLAQINSVFVTAEPASKQYDEPRGKQILYAFLGNHPNHP